MCYSFQSQCPTCDVRWHVATSVCHGVLSPSFPLAEPASIGYAEAEDFRTESVYLPPIECRQCQWVRDNHSHLDRMSDHSRFLRARAEAESEGSESTRPSSPERQQSRQSSQGPQTGRQSNATAEAERRRQCEARNLEARRVLRQERRRWLQSQRRNPQMHRPVVPRSGGSVDDSPAHSHDEV